MGNNMIGVVVGCADPPAGSTDSPIVRASPNPCASTESEACVPAGKTPPDRVPDGPIIHS